MNDQAPDTALPSAPEWSLVGILQVPKEDGIQCQCHGCGQRVYRRIHMILWQDARIECWGKDCYNRELGAAAKERDIQPMFPGLDGRELTEAERTLLTANREALIAEFRRQLDEAISRQSTPEARPPLADYRPAVRSPLVIRPASQDLGAAQERINAFAKELAEKARERRRSRIW